MRNNNKTKKSLPLLVAGILFFSLIAGSGTVFAKRSPKRIGKVYKIKRSRGQVYVSSKRAARVMRMGTKVLIKVNGKYIVLKVIYPMQTIAKCKVLRKYRKYIRKIRRGMAVYSYVKGIENQREANNPAMEQQNMINALKYGRSYYFKSVLFNSFIQANVVKNAKGTIIMEVAANKRNHPNMIKALIGGMNNRNPMVRAAIYGELVYFSYYKNSLKNDPRGKFILRRLKRKVHAASEKDYNAKAALNRLKSVFANSPQEESRNMTNALRSGKGRYFKYVSYRAFLNANVVKNAKGTLVMEIGSNPSNKINCINALMGGIFNRDVKVRAAIYGELAYFAYSKKTIKNSSRGKRVLKILNSILRNRKETDPNAKSALKRLKNVFALTVEEIIELRDYKALATMSLSQYNKSSRAELTVIGEMLASPAKGKRFRIALGMVFRAISYRRGNFETQMVILNEIQIVNYYQKDSIRKAVAKKLKRVKRRVRNKKLRKRIDEIVVTLTQPKGAG